MQPQIRMVTGAPLAWINASIASLRADPDIYVRDKELAHVTRISEEEAAASEWTDGEGRTQRSLVAGSPRIHPMTLPTLRVRMAQAASWTKPKPTKGGGFEDVACEPAKAQAEELRDEAHWPGLRHLQGISETPFLRPDLSIVQGAARYDPATGYLYEPALPFPEVAEAPTQADASRSREALEDLFCDFPFASPAGPSAIIAFCMTLIARPAIKGPCPAWALDATTQGTGKSTIADVCASIVHGRDAGRVAFPSTSGRSGDEELGKRLGFLARRGASLVFFDNMDDCSIAGDCLEEIISTPRDYTFRILGVTDGLTLPVRMLFAFSGNNISWSKGMTRRLLHVRLESPLADPEHRPPDTYQHPERAGCLLDYAIEHRAEYVHHLLTILRGYAAAGCPNKLTLGTFERWASLIPSAIVWAGGEDPMLCRPGADGEETPDTLQRQTIAREWTAFLQASGRADITAHDMIAALYPQQDRGAMPDPKWEILRGAIEYFAPPVQGHAPDARVLGIVLGRKLKGASVRTHDAPAPMRRFTTSGATGGRVRWKVEDVGGYVGGKLPSKPTKPRALPSPIVTPPPAEAPSVATPPLVCSVCTRLRGNRDDGACEPCPRCRCCNSYAGSPPAQSEVCRC